MSTTAEGVLFLTRHALSDSGPDDAITQPTNRGNKMRANAKYVREGALGYINAEEFYKEVCCSHSAEGRRGRCPRCVNLKDTKTDAQGLECI